MLGKLARLFGVLVDGAAFDRTDFKIALGTARLVETGPDVGVNNFVKIFRRV